MRVLLRSITAFWLILIVIFAVCLGIKNYLGPLILLAISACILFLTSFYFYKLEQPASTQCKEISYNIFTKYHQFLLTKYFLFVFICAPIVYVYGLYMATIAYVSCYLAEAVKEFIETK